MCPCVRPTKVTGSSCGPARACVGGRTRLAAGVQGPAAPSWAQGVGVCLCSMCRFGSVACKLSPPHCCPRSPHPLRLPHLGCRRICTAHTLTCPHRQLHARMWEGEGVCVGMCGGQAGRKQGRPHCLGLRPCMCAWWQRGEHAPSQLALETTGQLRPRLIQAHWQPSKCRA